MYSCPAGTHRGSVEGGVAWIEPVLSIEGVLGGEARAPVTIASGALLGVELTFLVRHKRRAE